MSRSLAVRKILEGKSVRKVLESSSSMMIQDFVDTFFDNNVDYNTVGHEFFWYFCLLDMSKKIKKDFDATFEKEEADWDEWFDRHWGVVVEYIGSSGFALAPDCEKAGIDWEDLEEFASKNRKLDYVTQYGGELYLVGIDE